MNNNNTYFGVSNESLDYVNPSAPNQERTSLTSNIDDPFAYLKNMPEDILQKRRLGSRNLGVIDESQPQTITFRFSNDFKADERYVRPRNVNDITPVDNYPINQRLPNHDIDSRGIITRAHLTHVGLDPFELMQSTNPERVKDIRDIDDTSREIPAVHDTPMKLDKIIV